MGETDPKLRHEFVGMMFAITVGEIGLQTAALVQAKHWIHYLPAYSHLFLATFVVAASWVGWSKSVIPGARQDVDELFEWSFLVLLLDMTMVVTYFILVRTVDFHDEYRRVDLAYVVAGWHVLIFALYLAWDVVTKIFMYKRPANLGWWPGWKHLDPKLKKKRTAGIRRMGPTLICLAVSGFLWYAFGDAKDERLLSADLTLLSVVLLFRALKSQQTTKQEQETAREEEAKPKEGKPKTLRFRRAWTAACVTGFLLGLAMTMSIIPVPLPNAWVQEIRTPVVEEKARPPVDSKKSTTAGAVQSGPRIGATTPPQPSEPAQHK
jgi:hypothetical protein